MPLLILFTEPQAYRANQMESLLGRQFERDDPQLDDSLDDIFLGSVSPAVQREVVYNSMTEKSIFFCFKI